ncbi:hypothetical protein [Micromonospora saelicesensis]|uniref:Uncharacterized protein n=1 Tax=Micromonospora saelicesensis TaxID=285676 RepID=A0A1C4W895_9ACTN|nr:hypothetical protein [Micromonospora saelicesensis]SCE92415.1 hypothetical protein GA0070561_2467 [Micromonospora saelicesensis]
MTTPAQATVRFVQLRRVGGPDEDACTTGPKTTGPLVDFRDDWSGPVRDAITSGDRDAAQQLFKALLAQHDELLDETGRLALLLLRRAGVDARLTVGQLREALTGWAAQRDIGGEQVRSAVARLTAWAVDALVLGRFLRLRKQPLADTLVRVLRGVTLLRLARSAAQEACLVRALLGGRDLVLPDPPASPRRPADPNAERADRFAELSGTAQRLLARARVTGRPNPTLRDLQADGFPDLGAAVEATAQAADELGAPAATTLRGLQRVFDAERDDARRRASARTATGIPDVDSSPGNPIPGNGNTVPYLPPRVPVFDAYARVAGRGDLMLIRTTHLRYEAADISHVENVLASEVRGRVHTVDASTKETVTTASQTIAESTEELESTEQNSLDRALQTAATQQTSTSLGVSVSGGFGPIQAGIEVNADRSNTTETSMSSAVSYAKTLAESASELLRTETSQRRTTTSRTRVTETNEHRFDNADGATNIAGIYRWLNKVDQAQVYNYGERLILEFIVPEPAGTLVWLAEQAEQTSSLGAVPEPPAWFLEVGDLHDDNYADKAARWDIFGVEPPPDFEIFATATFLDPAARPFEYSKNSTDKSQPEWGYTSYTGEVAVPAGYAATEAYVTVTWSLEEGEYSAEEGSPPQAVQIAIGEDRIVDNDTDDGEHVVPLDHVIPGPVPIGISADQRGGLTVVVRVRCERTTASYTAWQLRAWEAIRAGYLAQRTAYDNDQARRQARTAYRADQPASALRLVEQLELKRACQSLLTGQEFDRYGSLDFPADEAPRIDRLELIAEADHIQFCEDLFEWDKISYLCYSYQWAGRDRWATLRTRTSSDPLHQVFLQAGAARVMVPVRAGYEHVIGRYLATSEVPALTPRPWRGGHNPYPPIDDLISDALDRPGEEVTVGEPWEVVTPTDLIQLQAGTELNPAA